MKYSPLDTEHRALGAKMVPFGGWEMPLSYASGTLAEHQSCRSEAVMFDVSHLGTVRLEGEGSFERLQAVMTNDLTRVSAGRAQYTHLLDESDASVLDDIIIWWLAPEVFDVMPNASNTERVVGAIGGRDTTAERAVIAVQGPAARTLVGRVSAEAAAVKRFTVQELEVLGVWCVVAGTGYTGEDGVELAVPVQHAPMVWQALLGAGVAPAGLGARDTLRLEAALPLHGHELGPGITPLQANLGWVVSWDKPTFRGKDALAAERARGVRRILRGISVEGRRPAREGTVVLSTSGEPLGNVTSGNFSPTLGHAIALALVNPDVKIGDHVTLDVRGSALKGTVCPIPFVEKKK